MIGFDPVATAAAINAPEHVVVGMLIAIGKSASLPYPKTELPRESVLIYDFFPA
jgi:nitroreductase